MYLGESTALSLTGYVRYLQYCNVNNCPYVDHCRYVSGLGAVETPLNDALRLWYDNRENSSTSRKFGAVVTQLLAQRGSSLPSPLAEIYEDRALLSKPSKWIFGGSSWATDIG